jgi:hypothetical protein
MITPSERATDKQIGMLVYTVRQEFSEALTEHRDENGADMRYTDLEMFVRQNLGKYHISSLINVISDPDFDEKWRTGFLVDYLRQKGFDGV